MTVELSTSKPAMAGFSAGVMLTTVVFITTAGNSPALGVDFKLGCSSTTGLLVG